MRFETKVWHPNSTRPALLPGLTDMEAVYENGDVCISILHPPVEDDTGYEAASERWSPVQTPSTILLSVISMLSSPNDESPANVEAAIQFRGDPKEFKRRTRRCVSESQGL
jgi:ubiquitin-conjugating enzyme E2 G1